MHQQRPVITLLASLAPLFAASVCMAQITVTGVPPIRWGTSDGSIGLADATLEDFEDVNLVPGLQIRWTAPSGTVGPVSVLPRTCDPLTQDPTSNAFATGLWDGTKCLVSGSGNQIHPYSASQNWGDVEFLFNTPAKAVGFSIEQMDVDAQLIVNGVNLGGVLALSGLSTNGGFRAGYVIIAAAGSDTISSIKLDNFGGDGFAIDHMLITPVPAPVVTVTGFSPSVWPRPDSELGITPLNASAIEDFEDVNLAPGLQIGWESFSGAVTPSFTLPRTFNAITQDPFGNAFDNGPWDGTRTVINTRDNASHAYTGTGEWGDIIFRFDPPLQAVGFSIQQAESPVRLVVNGRDIGSLFTMAGLATASGRQGYIRIQTPCGGTPISEIRLNNTRQTFGGDGFAIDHLIMGTSLVFSTQPQDRSICPSDSANFPAIASAIGSGQYLWQVQDSAGIWHNLSDGVTPYGFSVTGAGTSSLTCSNITDAYAANLRRFRCVATNACGTATSTSAALRILGTRCSPADIADGVGDPLPPFTPCTTGVFNPGIDGGDFDCFFNFYFEPAPTNSVCDIADGLGEPLPPFGPANGFNPGVDGGDFDCFFNYYFNGCL